MGPISSGCRGLRHIAQSYVEAPAWTKDSAGVAAQSLDALGRTGEAAKLRQDYGLGPDGR